MDMQAICAQPDLRCWARSVLQLCATDPRPLAEHEDQAAIRAMIALGLAYEDQETRACKSDPGARYIRPTALGMALAGEHCGDVAADAVAVIMQQYKQRHQSTT